MEASVVGPNERTDITNENGKKMYILMHTFHDGFPNHPDEWVEDLEDVIADGNYTGKCPFDGCESVIKPEDIQDVLSDDFYAEFKSKFQEKSGAKRNTYRRKPKKSRKSGVVK